MSGQHGSLAVSFVRRFCALTAIGTQRAAVRTGERKRQLRTKASETLQGVTGSASLGERRGARAQSGAREQRMSMHHVGRVLQSSEGGSRCRKVGGGQLVPLPFFAPPHVRSLLAWLALPARALRSATPELVGDAKPSVVNHPPLGAASGARRSRSAMVSGCTRSSLRELGWGTTRRRRNQKPREGCAHAFAGSLCKGTLHSPSFLAVEAGRCVSACVCADVVHRLQSFVCLDVVRARARACECAHACMM